MILTDIRTLHYSKNYIEYEVNKQNIFTKWFNYAQLRDFTGYFIKEWINGVFKNWVIFTSPSGYAGTNNPIESFNAQFKKQFTKFSPRSLIDCVKLICDDVIPVYSESTREFKFTREPNVKVKNLAKKLDDKLFFISSNDPNLVYYYGLSSISTIDIFNKTCSCRWFMAYSTCAHLYKAFQLFYVQTASSKFVIRARRGPKKNGESKIETNEGLTKD
ncbi:unnamed protein product [Brachionus calyciflorus]|uniref:SWIM-type domain-containing protein n=1 Tax=Brachionus calyciflorus TaxID=104777 RepID=A0A813V3C5_9BILA|nr:unnamed protein product [Brachionus calyciflorus]